MFLPEFLGGLAAIGLLSALAMRLLKPMSDTMWRILVACSLALAAAVLISAYAMSAPGEPPDFVHSLTVYGPPVIVWFGLHMLGLRRRRAVQPD